MQRAARNVLNAFHQINQILLAALGHRCKSHATVAHHDRANAMARRWVHLTIPSHLPIIMRMNIDPGRSHNCAIRGDHHFRVSGQVRRHRLNQAILDGDVELLRHWVQTVINQTTANHNIVHKCSLVMGCRGLP